MCSAQPSPPTTNMAAGRVAGALGRVLPIVTYPNPVLRKKCAEVVFTTAASSGAPWSPAVSAVAQVAADLIATVKAGDGLGLAAPQVGRGTGNWG